jgi:hypothetical protein
MSRCGGVEPAVRVVGARRPPWGDAAIEPLSTKQLGGSVGLKARAWGQALRGNGKGAAWASRPRYNGNHGGGGGRGGRDLRFSTYDLAFGIAGAHSAAPFDCTGVRMRREALVGHVAGGIE